MANVATLSARAAFDVSAFKSGTQEMLSGLARIRSSLKDTGGELKGLENKTESAGNGLGAMTSLLGKGAIAGIAFGAAITTITSITNMASTAFRKFESGMVWGAELAMNAEVAEVGFSVMLGTAGKARDIMRSIEDFSLKTPFDVGGSTDVVTMLMGMGIATEDLLPAMKTLGDLSLGNRDKLSGLALAFGQVQAKGKLMSQEFNQFAERGINLRQQLADNLKIPISEVAKAMEDGKITADVFRNSLIDLAETKFGGMMEKQANTMLGQLNRIGETTGLIFKDINEGLGQAFGVKTVLEGVNGIMTDTRNVIRESIQLLREWKETKQYPWEVAKMAAKGVWYAAKQAAPVAERMHPMASLVGQVTRTFTSLGSSIKSMADARKPINDGKLQGLKRVDAERMVPGNNQLFDEIKSRMINSLFFAGMGMGGMIARMNTISPKGAVDKQQPYSPTGALRAGSSEAFSAIIKNMASGKKDSVDEKMLDRLKAIAADTAKWTAEVLKGGQIKLIEVAELGAGAF